MATSGGVEGWGYGDVIEKGLKEAGYVLCLDLAMVA